MRLCEKHRLGGIPALGKLDGVCVGCAVETKLQSAANECQEHITEDRGRIADLERVLLLFDKHTPIDAVPRFVWGQLAALKLPHPDG